MNPVNSLKTTSKNMKLYNIIEKVGIQKRYQKNEIIYLQDDPADMFFLLKSGRARLFFTFINGNELTLKILGSSTIFGETSYFSHTPRVTSASAFTDVELLAVDFQSLQPYLTEDPKLIAELLESMAQTIRLFSIQMYSMAFLSADKKVAHILVQLGSHFKKKETDEHYSIDYTHQELAELIGITRVTTTKELKRFEKRGWLLLSYQHIQILNEIALKDYLIS